MASPLLSVSKLTKQFPAIRAVDGISFDVREGEIVGLLGPNGAGKTTTIQLLLGLVSHTSGSISYFGKSFPKHREAILERVNFASAYAEIQHKLTVRQNLTIYAGLYNIPTPQQRIMRNLELLEVADYADTVYWHLSSGQRTRVILAKALLNRPKLILMDEPTASLDPEIARTVITLIRRLQNKHGVGILYTSHNMAEVEEICDRVLFLDHGKIVAEDTPLGLTKHVGNTTLSLTYEGKKSDVQAYLKHEKRTGSFPRSHRVDIVVSEDDIPRVLFGLKEKGIWITNISIKKPSLEDVFLSIAKGTYEAA